MPPRIFLVGPVLLVGELVLVWLCENARPLRRQTCAKWARAKVNVAMAIAGGLAMSVLYGPIVFSAIVFSSRHGLGLLRLLALPSALRWLRWPLSFLLLDYTLWVWHRLTHRVPLLWRFHAIHHADLDLDVTTALRFHAGELVASVPYRALQGLVFGIDLAPLLAWEIGVLLCAQLHHSNIRLPLRLETQLQRVFITPRLHGTHHSIDADEVSANFGTMLSLWDRLHGTHLWRGDQQPRVIGIPEARAPLSGWQALRMPFTRQPLPVPERRE